MAVVFFYCIAQVLIVLSKCRAKYNDCIADCRFQTLITVFFLQQIM